MLISWTEKRDRLCKLIKEVSDIYGGDDREWLRGYAQDVVKKYATELDVAIGCFERICREAKCAGEFRKNI